MATRIDDRWLWLALGAFTFIAIKGVSRGLHTIRTLTEVHQPAPQPRIPRPKLGKEDAIKTSSLEILAASPNVEIRKSATKILCERFFAHTSSRARIFKELNSENPGTRHRARLAFNLLCEYGVAQDDGLPPTPRALRSSRTRARGGFRGAGNLQEQDLRRRRREAMVINEGDRPVSQEDVYMRDGEGRMSTEQPRSLGDVNILMGTEANAQFRDVWQHHTDQIEEDIAVYRGFTAGQDPSITETSSASRSETAPSTSTN